MSKVYEALRQKQNENSGAFGNNLFDVDVVTIDQPAPEDGLELTNSVLKAALSGEDEMPRSGPVAAPTFPPVAPDTTTEQKVSSNGYRKLWLAKKDTSRLVFLTEPHGPAAEQFRFLRRSLEQKFPKGGVLLVTSPAPRDGKTLTSINLSACLADSGRSTLLVEGDIRQPAVGKVLGTSIEGPGIEEALAGSVDPARTIHLVENLSFHVSMVQNPPADPARVVSGTAAKQCLAWARERFHWVIIDSPPVLPAVDVAHLGALVDAVLLVVRAQSTPRDLLTRAFEMLGDRLSGVVLNEATVESNPYYRYLSDYRPKSGSPHPNGSGKAEEKKD